MIVDFLMFYACPYFTFEFMIGLDFATQLKAFPPKFVFLNFHPILSSPAYDCIQITSFTTHTGKKGHRHIRTNNFLLLTLTKIEIDKELSLK